MSVSKHPSVKPTPPAAPKRGEDNKKEGVSGQAGVEYGFRHELQVKDPNKSEMSHHFHDSHSGKEASNEPREMSRASKPGDEKRGEPG